MTPLLFNVFHDDDNNDDNKSPAIIREWLQNLIQNEFRETIEILQEEKLQAYIKSTILLFLNSVLCKSKVIMWHSQEAIGNLADAFYRSMLLASLMFFFFFSLMFLRSLFF